MKLRWQVSGLGALLGLALLLFLGLGGMAEAQVAQGYWQCRVPTATTEAGWCPTSSINPLPIGIQATVSVPISFTAAGGPTQIIAASGTKAIYVTQWDVVLSGAGTFALVTGTGANCGTGTTYLTGSAGHPLSFGANGGISAGSGLGPVLVTAAGGALCAITTGAVDSSGSIAYAQF